MGIVKDIISTGGRIPKPMNEQGPQKNYEQRMDPLDEVLDIKRKRAAIRALDEGDHKGDNAITVTPKVEETVAIQAIRAQGAMMDKVFDRLSKDGDGKNDVFLKEYLTLTKELLTAPQQDPIETYRKVQGLMSEMEKQLIEKMGLKKDEVPASGQNIGLLLELEKYKSEREQRNLEFQAWLEEERHKRSVEDEERRARFQLDVKNGDREYELKILELKDKRVERERTGGILEDILGSVMNNVQSRNGEHVNEVEQVISRGNEIKQNPQRQPDAFECPSCQNRVDITDPSVNPVECTHCGEEYDLSSAKWI